MSFKASLLDIWENQVIEGTNRKALASFQKATKLWHKGGLLNQLRAMRIHNRNIRHYNCEIYPQANIGEGLYIPHCVGIVVGSTTVIGKNCTIYPNVVFGASHSPKDVAVIGRRHAIVGDNCTFGANTSVIGAISIGHDVTIGAGAVITKNIPDYAIVVGVNQIIGYKEHP